jgi:uracil-DNA glycosylase
MIDETPVMLPVLPEPSCDCPLCPRLVAYREEQRVAHPDWFNAPVPAFGDPQAWLAIIGYAPGLQGANRTGRVFTGDGSGNLLYATLAMFGLSEGAFTGKAADGVTLRGALIVNAVRCLPPQNKATPAEIRICRQFLEPALKALPNLKVVIALGEVAHKSTTKAIGGKLPKMPFSHGAEHRVPSGLVLLDSYHCSRYNQNTGRLTAPMFESVFARAVALRDGG